MRERRAQRLYHFHGIEHVETDSDIAGSYLPSADRAQCWSSASCLQCADQSGRSAATGQNATTTGAAVQREIYMVAAVIKGEYLVTKTPEDDCAPGDVDGLAGGLATEVGEIRNPLPIR